jgi:ABC-type multidrug transport system permease subunit
MRSKVRRGYFSSFPYFWFTFFETDYHRLSIGIHFWYARGNLLRLNRQPFFCELRLARCICLTYSRFMGKWTNGNWVSYANLRISVYRVRERP